MRVRLPAAERRRQLLDVAVEVFAERGFHRTSMHDVAERAGVTKPVLYQHFPSKRALYLAALEDVGGRLQAAVDKAAAEAHTPHEQVEHGFVAYFRFVAEEQAAFRLLFGSGARRDEEFADAVRSIEATIAEGIAPLIHADVEPQHRRLLAFGLVGMAESAGRQALADGETFDPDRMARQLADLAWFGLRGVRRT